MKNIQAWDLNNALITPHKKDKSSNDGQLIRLPIPDLSEERRNEMKMVGQWKM